LNESLATCWEHVAAAVPDQVAIRHRGQSWTYRAFDDRAARLAGALERAGVVPGARVACYLYNSAAYLETLYAALKLSAVPVNVNYRYRQDELTHLLADSGTEVIVFHSSLADRVADVLPRLAGMRLAIQVADEPAELVAGAVELEDLVAGAEPVAPRPRSGQDELLVYTGGTTGLPKGVIWPHGSLFDATAFSAYRAAGKLAPASLEGILATAIELVEEGSRTVSLPVVPLMHTTGLFVTIGTLLIGGTVVFSPSRSLDPPAVLALVQEAGVTQLVIAGNAVARPLAEEIARAEAAGRPYDLSSLERIISSGVAWSDDVKRFFLERGPIQLAEILGASEGGPFATSVATSVDDLPSRFFPTDGTKVLVDDIGTEATPGSGQIGVLAFTGAMPVGYYGDPHRTSATYRLIDGQRYVIPGDHATVAADGSIRLLGRGAAVINTGGEKVYATEVEEVLLTHPAVLDCAVVGVPDERWGEAVAAVVQLRDPVSDEDLSEHVAARLAGYKKPRHVVVVDAVQRGPNGKVELRWARQLAAERLGKEATS
jgi:acyl-CoA synthetase (AMP-forming)/AMP-acid ligase II